MRFLIVSLGIHPDVVGGAWRVAAAQAAGLAARGHTVEVVTAQQDPPRPATEDRDGFTLHRFPQHHGHFHANWRAENRAAHALLTSLLAANPSVPTLLIQHHAYLEPAVARIPRSWPVLHVFHGPWAEEYRSSQTARPRSPARRLLDVAVVPMLHHVEKRALRRAQRIIVLSRHFAEHLARWHPGLKTPVEIVPGGVDLDLFTPVPDAERRRLREGYGLLPDNRLFVAMRRLDPRMGLEILLDAFSRIAPRFPKARLWLTGRGPAEASLRARIAQHGLEGSVRLLGFLPEAELPALLNAADAALMPSLDLEGFGLATAEALACGTPVLGSRAGATPELLEPLDPGLLFQPGSTAALIERLEKVLRTDAALPPRAQCAAYARERFSWNAQVSACERAGDALTLKHREPDA